jgi:uncharacterized membrane protein YdjX (TVP38/TMEM64 family)
MRVSRRYGVLAVLIPSLLPPPAPFKIFVLLAGVAKVSVGTFALAVGVGRGARYFAEGLLALWYGERAIEFIRVHGREVAFVVAAVVLVAGVLYFLWRARTAGSRRPAAER